MSPVVALGSGDEAAYVLVGIPLAGDADEVRVLTSPESVVAYPAEGRRVIDYFTQLRSRTDALAQLASWRGGQDDLDALVASGLVLELPPEEGAVRERLGPLALRLTTGRVDGRDDAVLLRLGGGRAALISEVTALVLGGGIRALDTGVSETANVLGSDPERIWHYVLPDLTGVLANGAGQLVRVGGGGGR